MGGGGRYEEEEKEVVGFCGGGEVGRDCGLHLREMGVERGGLTGETGLV